MSIWSIVNIFDASIVWCLVLLHRSDSIQSRDGSSISVGGGADPPGGSPTYDFAIFSEKLHEIEKILGWVGASNAKVLTSLPVTKSSFLLEFNRA